MLRVRIWPECPEGNLSKLTWASKPDCGIATTRKALRHRQARAQNKGLNRSSQLQTTHSSDRQPELEGGNHSPRETLSTKLQAGFVANQDFLGFWTVNICLRRCTGCTPRKPSSRDRAHQTPGHLSCSDLGRAQNAGPTKPAPLRTTQVPEPEQLRPGRCMQPRVSLGQFPMKQPRA